MKRIVITGGSGMIGRELVELLHKDKNNHIVVIDNRTLKTRDIPVGVDHYIEDLRGYSNVKRIIEGADEVYHLAGIKGNPIKTEKEPFTFMLPMIQFDSNVIKICHEVGVKKLLYTSSIAVLNPQTDRFPAWAKNTGEMLIEAYRRQFSDMQTCIVRPSNVYGKYDNFEAENPMVITALIRKGLEGKLEVWGDGSQTRDFINARDVAKAMIETMRFMPLEAINLGSNEEYSIREIAEIIGSELHIKPTYDLSKKVGDQRRVMETNTHLINFTREIGMDEGIREIIEYLKEDEK